jgi:hypothetical protein
LRTPNRRDAGATQESARTPNLNKQWPYPNQDFGQ